MQGTCNAQTRVRFSDPALMTTSHIYTDIVAERNRQNNLFPRDVPFWRDNNHIKLAVLAEEFGEVARAVLEEDYENLRDELIQTAAVCVKWLEAIDNE